MADGAIIVALVGGFTYLGVLLRFGALNRFDVAALFQSLIISVASWLILGFATWFSATRLFGSSGRPQTLIAMQGLAALPLLLEIMGSPISWIGLVWYLAILVIATKEGTDLDYKFAAVSVLIGFAVTAIIRLLIGAPFALMSGLFA
jgi:hypothetical protein